MKYHTVTAAREADGLRLVLTAGNPGPWGEAVKAICKVKGLAYMPVRQEAGGDNVELRAWTGHRNAPLLIADDGEPRAHWLDILQFIERLQPEPGLIPKRMAERITMLGMLHEVAGYKGLGWYRRLLVFQPLMENPESRALVASMATAYGYSDAELRVAEARCVEVLSLLSEQLRQQAARGRAFFFGETLSALDLYWAAFSNMIRPLPAAECPMPAASREAYETLPKGVAAAADPILFQHRDQIWRETIGLPMSF